MKFAELRSVEFPLPPRDEQHDLLDRLHEFERRAGDTTNRLTAVMNRFDGARQAHARLPQPASSQPSGGKHTRLRVRRRP